MAGTVTLSESWGLNSANLPIGAYGRMRLVTWNWTSDASGDVQDATNGTTAHSYSGWIAGVWTIPDGSTAPTALYDVTILDSDGMDLLEGGGADRSATLKERVSMVLPMPLPGRTTLKLRVQNAGNAKLGEVVVLLLDPAIK